MPLVRYLVSFCLLMNFQSFYSNGAESDFFPFGMAAGDTCNLETGNMLILSTPVIFYRSPYTNLWVKPAGVVSFRRDFTREYFNGISLPFLPENNAPFLAPFWSSNQDQGSICFRQTSDSSLLQKFVDQMNANNSTVVGFQPVLLVLVTWMDPINNVSFQVTIATDGVNSFSRYFYGYLNPDINYIVGFNEGDSVGGAAIGGTEATLTRVTEQGSMASSIYRIDGRCVTLLLNSCPLPSVALSCSDSSGLVAETCTCRPGMEMVNGTCEDINECLNSSSCAPGNDCTNTIGSFTCQCRSGFHGSSRIQACIDSNECLIGSHDCDSNAICNNTEGSFNCTCRDGFIGNGITCVREGINSNCTEGSANCECVNVSDGRTCYCRPGYMVTPELTCQDVDECTESIASCNSVTSLCINTMGSYLCGCFSGYTTAPDGITCADINECTASLHNCHSDANCINTDGSYSCRCNEGFNGNGTHCFPGAPCSPGTHSCQICAPTMGNSFVCLCPPGFFLGSDGFSCHDVNECVILNHNCNTNANCSNTNGSFTCECRDGFYGNGVTCLDIDECSDGLVDCGIRQCQNTPGGFECVCPDDFPDYDEEEEVCGIFIRPRIKHIPVNRPVREHVYGMGNDFCLEGNDDDIVTVTFLCVQDIPLAFPRPTTTWTYVDRNGFGLTISLDLNIPVKFNDSVLILGPVPLSYFGSSRNSVRCLKSNGAMAFSRTFFRKCGPNECDLGVLNNCSMNCTRNGTEHSCSCNENYELSSDGATCIDINECEDNDTCDNFSTRCLNRNGTHECLCLPGFEHPPEAMSVTTFNYCVDIDECEQNISGCGQKCNNSIGSFICSCETGYNLLPPDYKNCSDVDECKMNIYNCSDNQRCINTVGSYFCQCSSGYELNSDMSECIDVDECESTESNDCDTSSTNCRNLNGSYECICQEGYRSSMNRNKSCIDINECIDNQTLCNGMICQNTNGSFQCLQVCNSFYVLNGVECQVSAAAVGGFLAGIVAILLILIVLVIIVFLRKYKKASKPLPYGGGKTMLMEPIENLYVDVVSHKFPENFRINRIAIEFFPDTIAEGEFGIVYKAKYNNEIVAVKTPKSFSGNNDSNAESFYEEIQKMMSIKEHENVLTLIGVTTNKDNNLGIVMPFMWHGSLDVYLKQNKDKFLIVDENFEEEDLNKITKKLLEYGLQIARGMAHLSSEGIIHRDLAARNCMLNSTNQVKISDFGLALSSLEDAKDYVRLSDITKENLPWRWMALECFTDYKFSEASDVWSYGVTCWEIFSASSRPYPEIGNRDLLEFLKSGQRMEKPNNFACTEEIYEMTMKSCWHEDPSLRLPFHKLAEQIDAFLMDQSDYTPLQT